MKDFDRYGFSTKQDLAIRAAYSLCRAGWMLVEINSALKTSDIRPEEFQLIRQQATALDQLQRKFGPPPGVSSAPVSSSPLNAPPLRPLPHPTPLRLSGDNKPMQADISRLPTLRVMNRGIEEAAAVLSHHGWHVSQIRTVLKASTTPLGDLGLVLLHELQEERQAPHRAPHTSPLPIIRKAQVPGFKIFIILFGLGIALFIGVSLILPIL